MVAVRRAVDVRQIAVFRGQPRAKFRRISGATFRMLLLLPPPATTANECSQPYIEIPYLPPTPKVSWTGLAALSTNRMTSCSPRAEPYLPPIGEGIFAKNNSSLTDTVLAREGMPPALIPSHPSLDPTAIPSLTASNDQHTISPAMGLFVQIHDIWWVLASVAVAVYIGSKIRAYRRLRAFKGPFSTGFSELWHSRVLLGLRSHVKYKEVCDKYGAY